MLSGLRGEDKEKRGYIETMLIVSFSDGELEDDEIDVLVQRASRHPKMAGMNHNEFMRYIKRSLSAMDRQGLEKRVEEVCKLLTTKEMRLTGIDLALSVAMADGELEPDEDRLINRMIQLMGLTQADVQPIIDRYR
ncbi:hypothetical protein FBR02_05990 [Anaerolineae bacterium CFX9]|nr:hypothetical protein [Anaerolineae bacterium CFX9]